MKRQYNFKCIEVVYIVTYRHLLFVRMNVCFICDNYDAFMNECLNWQQYLYIDL